MPRPYTARFSHGVPMLQKSLQSQAILAEMLMRFSVLSLGRLGLELT